MKAHILILAAFFAFFCVSAKGATPAEISAEAMEGYRLFSRDSLPDDREKGYAMMLSAAWEGDAKAANNIGWIMQHGLHGEANLKDALRWYERSADQGLPAAALNYVDLLMSSPDLPGEDSLDTGRLARAAMLAGSAMAMGRGLPYDYRRGEELIFKAGLLGDGQAALTIAQQLELYPDSFSYLPIEDIVAQCDSLLPPGLRNLPGDMTPRAFADVLLTPQFWYSRLPEGNATLP